MAPFIAIYSFEYIADVSFNMYELRLAAVNNELISIILIIKAIYLLIIHILKLNIIIKFIDDFSILECSKGCCRTSRSTMVGRLVRLRQTHTRKSDQSESNVHKDSDSTKMSLYFSLLVFHHLLQSSAVFRSFWSLR